MKKKGEIVVFSDPHVAKSWNIIDNVLKGKTNFLNPNKEFENFIKKINKNSKVKEVILNGDVVDYYFQDYVHDSNGKSNWDLFYSYIDKLKKPFFMVPGNHDFRKEPYNYSLYRLKHINISDKIRRKFKKQIGFYKCRWLKEFDSVLVNLKKFDAFQKYKGEKWPFEKIIRGYKCIFLDSGRDACIRMRNWPKFAKEFLFTGKLGLELFDNADGLSKDQIEFVRKSLKKPGKDVYIFMHAPLISSQYPEYKTYQLSEKDLFISNAKQNLNFCTMINNLDEFLDVLRKSNKNISLITAHTHYSKYYLINKNSLKAEETSLKKLNKQAHNSNFIKQISIWPIGELSFKRRCPKRKTGYLKITPKGFKEAVVKEFD